MLSKLKDIKLRYEVLSQDIINPDIIADMATILILLTLNWISLKL